MTSEVDISVFWIGGAMEQIVPNLEDGKRVLVEVELLVIFSEGALLAAPCTEKVHEGPSIMEEIFLFEMHLRGSKNSDFCNEGNGSSSDSKGRRSRPLSGILGSSEPHRTFLFEEGTTSG